MIKHCPNCKPHEQDKIHGQQKRVMNPTKSNTFRCTVCGLTTTENAAAKKGK